MTRTGGGEGERVAIVTKTLLSHAARASLHALVVVAAQLARTRPYARSLPSTSAPGGLEHVEAPIPVCILLAVTARSTPKEMRFWASLLPP